MVHSANGHRTRKGGNGGAPPDLYTIALALHSTPLGPSFHAMERTFGDTDHHLAGLARAGGLI